MSERATEVELIRRLADAERQVVVGGIYVHYRNDSKQYRVESIGIDEATEQPVVLYRSLYGAKILWSRQLSNWLDSVEGPTGPVARFRQVRR